MRRWCHQPQTIFLWLKLHVFLHCGLCGVVGLCLPSPCSGHQLHLNWINGTGHFVWGYFSWCVMSLHAHGQCSAYNHHSDSILLQKKRSNTSCKNKHKYCSWEMHRHQARKPNKYCFANSIQHAATIASLRSTNSSQFIVKSKRKWNKLRNVLSLSWFFNIYLAPKSIPLVTLSWRVMYSEEAED